MKKYYLLSVVSIFMLLFTASCSQEEIIPSDNQSKGKVSLSVNIPVNNPVTRAVPNIPAGYKLRCIMQLIDAQGTAIAGQRYTQEVASGNENVTFTFTAPESGYHGAAFWADYVKGDIETDNLYNTTSLLAISYNTANIAEMFNNDAADAFFGYMLSGQTSAQLRRPFTKLTFKSTDAAYANYTTIKLTELPAPTGFNVRTGETAGNATGMASGDLSIAGEVWFSIYLFVGSNTGANLGQNNDIKLTLTGGGEPEKNLVMAGENITLTQNYDVTANVTATPNNETDVTVTFPGGMIDPNQPQPSEPLAVGNYINKDGSYSATYDANNTIAVVYALAAGKTDNSNYGADKTVAGYAMALNGIARAKLLNAENTSIVGTEALSAELYAGEYGMAPWLTFKNLFTGETSALLTAFDTWKGENPITGTNLSEWYVPTPTQMKDLVGTLYNEVGWTIANVAGAEVTFPTKNAELFAAYAAGRGDEINFGLQATATNFLTSVLASDSKMVSIQIVETDKKMGTVAVKNGNPVAIRPVLTVFE